VNILIVKLSALGDVTHTLPALTALRRAYPEASIDWLVEEVSAPIVEGHGALDRLLVWSRRRFTGALKSGRLLEAGRILFGFVSDLRGKRYDLVLDFQALMKSGVWVFLARGRRKVGFGRGMDHMEGSWVFLNERVPAVSMEVHALDRGLKLLEGVGIGDGKVVYDFAISSRARERVDDLVGKEGEDSRPLVAMHPVTRWRTKQWTEEGFAEVAKGLLARGYRVVFSGAPQDKGVLDLIEKHAGMPLERTDGKLDLKGVAALFERADVVVSTDTGPMHIAVAVGTPVVALFGPTSPNRTGPHGEGNIVLQGGVGCSPCFSKVCRTPMGEPMGCMGRIRPGEVVKAVEAQLRRRGVGV
jgi:3-deoxy-D-manno-octulosonic-acid transferase/heptosyltransferase-1